MRILRSLLIFVAVAMIPYALTAVCLTPSCSLLFFNTVQSDLGYAVDGFGIPFANYDTGYPTGKTHYLEYDWEPGLRLGLVADFCNGWHSEAFYTYFRTKANGDASGTPQLLPTLLYPRLRSRGGNFDADTALTASGTMMLDMDSAHIGVGRTIDFCNGFCLTPSIGLQGMVLKQELSVSYDGEEFSSPSGLNWDSNFTGMGLRGAAHLDLYRSSSFSYFFEGAFSVLVGKSTNNQYHITTPFTPTVFEDPPEDPPEEPEEPFVPTYPPEDEPSPRIFLPPFEMAASDDYYLGVFGAHASLGVRSSWIFLGKEMVVSLSYEMSFWGNVPTMRRYMNSWNAGKSAAGGRGHLMIHGLNFQISHPF